MTFTILGLSRATKLALSIVLAFMLITGAAIAEYGLIEHVIHSSQSQWCDTLDLLTKQKIPYPADPAKNPSRLEAYDLYQDFTHLKAEFNCRS